MNLLDLFSGIGAFSLGLERSGAFRTVAFCETDPYARRVLAKHWPEVPCYDDIRSLTAEQLRADGIAVDAICGGFPCQPHSVAGTRGASSDDRDLWPEFARLIREIRPRWVVAENVPGLRSSESGRFFGGILRDLAECGYDTEWTSICAADIGAPHRRERVWIVAYPDGEPRDEWRTGDAEQGARGRHADRGGVGLNVRHPHSAGLAQREGERGDPRPKLTTLERADWWAVEPDVGRVAARAPARVDRLKALGNSLVPQIPKMIGEAILKLENGR